MGKRPERSLVVAVKGSGSKPCVGKDTVAGWHGDVCVCVGRDGRQARVGLSG